ncbi:S8 family serine peptidase, partial [bacterium]|nr:S8 family serine peptidase [bacterium]
GGHGTNCAGCSTASTDNGIGIAGAAWGCKVMGVRVGFLEDGETQGVVRMDFASSGMIYAAQTGAKIINCSWGSSSYLSYAIQYCTLTKDAIVVNAAGNDDWEASEYMGTHPSVISVAATDQNDAKASFSNYGSWVEVSAPGVAIYTTAWNQATGSHGYSSVQGTSFSAPITCGALGLLWSAHPTWGRSQITSLLLSNCDEIDSINPTYAGKLGAGRVNLLKALGDGFHKVPDELPTIFDALNSASAGDSIGIKGSSILDGPVTILNMEVVLGGWDDTFTSRDPINNPTTIQASVTSTALQFSTGVGNGTIVDGFKLIGGGGQFLSSIPVNGYYGGGIVINQTSPTLRNIQVTDCTVGNNSTHGSGGGVLLRNSNAVLHNVDVYGCTANEAAGIYIYEGSPTLYDCDVYDNIINTNNTTSDFLGGGIAMREASVMMQDCTVTGHSGLDNGGGIYADNSSLYMYGCTVSNNSAITKGCGLWFSGSELEIDGGEFSNNTYDPSAVFSNGGGIYTTGFSKLFNVKLSGNSAHSGSAVLFDGSSSAQIDNCVVVDNSAGYYGTVTLQNCSSTSVTYNTVANNSATVGGAGFHNSGCAPDYQNNLVAFNSGGASFANGFSVNNTAATFSCNDAYGNDGSNYSGTTDPTGSNYNISEDPLFCDMASGDYGLTEGSPCLDGCEIGALGQECTGGASAIEPVSVPLVFSVSPNYPNPFNPMTTISF